MTLPRYGSSPFHRLTHDFGLGNRQCSTLCPDRLGNCQQGGGQSEALVGKCAYTDENAQGVCTCQGADRLPEPHVR